MKYNVIVSDCGPLSFRKGRDTATTDTHPYVPGGTLRGGLSAAHIKLRQAPDEFGGFFVAEDTVFGNLYPATSKQAALNSDDNPVQPLPHTSRTCKRFPGFTADGVDPEDEPAHGVHDTLIGWALFEESNRTNVSALRALKNCPRCGEPMDSLHGFYRRDCYDSTVMGMTEATKAMRTRTGIARATDTVASGILYSREMLRAGNTFWGRIAIPDDRERTFYTFVEEANQSGLLRLGNNRTRGFGRVTLHLSSAEEDEDVEAVAKRLRDFNTALAGAAEENGVMLTHQQYLPITLTSDLILRDPALRYHRGIPADYIMAAWGLPDATLVYQNSSTRRVMGWNALWRLPKPEDLAIGMGSVFLFGLDTNLTDEALTTLSRAEQSGIGQRRTEGFGQFRIADPFHWEVKGA